MRRRSRVPDRCAGLDGCPSPHCGEAAVEQGGCSGVGSDGRLRSRTMQAPQPPIRTDRLILRRPVRDDAAAVFSYSSDPLVTRLLTFPPSTDIAESRAFLARCDRMWSDGSAFPLGITLSDADRLIGMIELHPTDHGVELGYVLARAYWGMATCPKLFVRLLTGHWGSRPSCGFLRIATSTTLPRSESWRRRDSRRRASSIGSQMSRTNQQSHGTPSCTLDGADRHTSTPTGGCRQGFFLTRGRRPR